MDARALLADVARTYRDLKSLEGEALSISESGDEGSRQRNESVLRFRYAAPDKIRLEQPGRHGNITVSDGIELKTYIKPHRRYFRNPRPPMDQFPGTFRPEFPVGVHQGAVLFGAINRRVTEAEMLEDETLRPEGVERRCFLVRVTFEPPPIGFRHSSGPVRFWIDSETRLVRRSEGEMELTNPRDGSVTVSRRILEISKLAVNESIPDEAFQFSPPAGLVEHAEVSLRERAEGEVGLAGGGPREGETGHNSFDSSVGWEHDAFVERCLITFRGNSMEIERRWEMSEGSTELRFCEFVRGPKGVMERKYAIPLR